MSGGRKLSKEARKKIDEWIALFDRPLPSLIIYEDCIEGERIVQEGIKQILKKLGFSEEAGG